LPQGKNKVDDFIPVARLTDMLLNPGKSFDFNGEKRIYPKIDLIYWVGGNPFHHHQDLNRLVDAWQKPSTIIVNEWCWNSLAKHADIVLPCTTTLERNDLGMTPRDPYVIAMSKAFEPIGLARDDYEIFTAIAEKLDIKEEFTEGRSTADWLEWIWDQSRKNTKKTGINMPSYKQFITKGWYQAPSRETDEILLADFFKDPVDFPLSTPSGKIEIFSEVVAAFNYDGCAGHPTWIEPAEWLGAANKQHPFHLISIQPETKLHGQLDNGKLSLSAKINGHEVIEINPADAASKNLKNSDTVRVFNQRGTCYCGVKITEDVMPGVVVIRTGSWYDPMSPGTPMTPCKHGNPNVLTPDIGTSKIAQGPAAHSCLVDFEKYHGSPLQITAHEPPKITRSAAKNRH
jgi:biotin/methionine sulfoxide reductase